ncbi:MAG TPA: hypothetical protein PLJ35_03815 [Anaerolineae bacterium]|nr:hypothetical protein [Anaerolineae bacterium]HOQ97930.1 hypothetical protein [Anaerolineae bacterium]
MKRLLATLLVASVLVAALVACAPAAPKTSGNTAQVGAVTVQPHPATLDGKTVALRWNEKPNGDKLLTRLAELLAEKYQDVKIIKLWEQAPETAAISKSMEDSQKLAATIAALKPDLVIASQAD